MKKLVILVALFTVIGVAVKAIASVEVKNEDSKGYSLVVKCGGAEEGKSVNANARTMFSFSGRDCKLLIKGASGGIALADNATYIIKNGTISKK